MYTATDATTLLGRVAETLTANRETLCQLDGKAGDGDLGFSMESAAAAMTQAAAETPGDDLGRYFLALAAACGKAAPSTMGTLLASGLMALGRACKGLAEVGDAQVVAMPRLFADAIAARGKAKPGDKTILDALYPMAETAEAAFSASRPLAECFSLAADSAETAARATAGMQANVGRARWIGERASEHPDAGAVLCGMIARALVGGGTNNPPVA